MLKVVGVGAGGHGRVLLDALLAAGGCEVVGMLDGDPARLDESFLGVPILGGEELLDQLWEQGVRGSFVGVGSVGSPERRMAIFERLGSLGFEPVSTIHPSALLSPFATLGPGLMALARCVVNPGARLGQNVILNTGCIVEHDCRLGDHVHVSPGAILCGNVVVGEESHVGAGAVVRQGVRLGRGVMVGAGAVVVRDVPDGWQVLGCPARRHS